jgi:hypothetical protein
MEMMNPAISSPIGFERLSAMSNREFGEIALSTVTPTGPFGGVEPDQGLE